MSVYVHSSWIDPLSPVVPTSDEILANVMPWTLCSAQKMSQRLILPSRKDISLIDGEFSTRMRKWKV
jgi:hypothetical protein